MRLVGLLLLSLAAAACGGNDNQVCPPDWNNDTTAPGGCAVPTSYTSGVSTGVYGFVRTNTHGSNQLVVGSVVFVVDDSNTTCQAPSVNPINQTTTDDNGIFSMQLSPGTYRLTSGEVPKCVEFTVDASQTTDVPLTQP